ncbi:GntR family transcriptional regulator [Neisseriaceae bacterium TC5R-5]|nr:GntR family transcriptional regulator [Neisseriaceae bacterium TC5R-5]
MSPKIKTSLSASQRVYLDLRQRILEMILLPGTRIIERDFAAEHGTSRTPVHEAVQRLADEGLIEIVQRVGTFVARIPLDKLEEAMLVRTALEVVMIEKAVARATEQDIARLQNILAEQEECMLSEDRRGFYRADEAFHQHLTEIAGFPGVWRLIQQAKIQVDRYRRLTLMLPARMDSVIAEHRAVVTALESANPTQAAGAMRVHLDKVLPGIELARAFRPEYFINHLPEGEATDAYW